MKILVPITGPDMETAKKDVEKANTMNIYGIEVRYDLIKDPAVYELLRGFSKPVVFTNMRKLEGGKFEGSDKEWIDIFSDVVDISHYISVGKDYYHLINGIETRDAEIIASYHNSQGTPHNLEDIYNGLRGLEPEPDIVKLATKANSYSDALRILNLIHKAQLERQKIVGLPMGPYGTWVRFVGPKFGSEFTFAALDKSKISGLGQPLVDQLYEGVEILQLP